MRFHTGKLAISWLQCQISGIISMKSPGLFIYVLRCGVEDPRRAWFKEKCHIDAVFRIGLKLQVIDA
jgi:hypothetical protein